MTNFILSLHRERGCFSFLEKSLILENRAEERLRLEEEIAELKNEIINR